MKFFLPHCFGLGIFSYIEDNQLDDLVQTASSKHPEMGLRMLKGYLQSKGFCIQIIPVANRSHWYCGEMEKCHQEEG